MSIAGSTPNREVASQAASDSMIVMGQIATPHGVKGWVKLKVFTETPDSLLQYPVWWLKTRSGWREYKVASIEWRESGLVAKLEGFDDRTTIESLKGMQIGIPRAAFPAPKFGEYYWTDLIGLEVVNKQDELLGIVEGLVETGANDVLVVFGEHGGDPEESAGVPAKKVERLIPYIDSVIVSVDLANRRITVDWSLDY